MGIIGAVGLTSNLVYCFDAGDPASYAGTGQDWTDLSGNGRTYQRGTTSAVEASDPTFNGVAGSLDETNYWGFDGGDSFTPVTTPTTFDDNWAKASGAVTMLSVFRGISSVARGLCGDQSGAVNNGGLSMGINASEKLEIDFNLNDLSTGTGFTRGLSTGAITLSAIQLVAIAFDASGAIVYQINGTQESATVGGGFAPLSGVNNPPADWTIGDSGFFRLANGDRLYAAAAWSTKLSTGNLTALYNMLKANRFTSLP